jgi:NAD-dependent deacetylase
MTEEGLRKARELVAGARRVAVLTGAGISAESGVPTFRGAGGLWKQYRAEELATPEAFARDPRLVWEWYGWRREKVRACAPNAAHVALARFALGRGGGGGRAPTTTIVTQNVDGLHGAAARAVAAEGGLDPAPGLPVELHGSIVRVRCTRCSACHEDAEAEVDAASLDTLPRCRACRALARPDVVWFGESLPEDALRTALAAARAADVCIVVGTSAVVQPAASIPLLTAEGGGAVIEVNPEPTPLTGACDVSLRSGAVAALPSILGLAAP